MELYSGQIIKAMSGFYYVRPDSGEKTLDKDNGRVYQCRAKGIFRKKGISPLVGDRVSFELTETDDVEGNVAEIHERKNSLVRPMVANVDQALVIFSMHTPEPAFNLLDRFLILMQKNKIEVILVFNKDDLGSAEEAGKLKDIYRDAEIRLLFTSTFKGSGLGELKELLKGKLTTVAGPSGVGKSSLINAISGKELMETGSLSRKIGRGKQTTRHVELLEIQEASYIIDTPGFSSLELPDIEETSLDSFFPELDRYKNDCYFTGCSHRNEPGCEIKKRLSEGLIPMERYSSYSLFYDELMKRRRY